jgi:hypothetical protein
LSEDFLAFPEALQRGEALPTPAILQASLRISSRRHIIACAANVERRRKSVRHLPRYEFLTKKIIFFGNLFTKSLPAMKQKTSLLLARAFAALHGVGPHLAARRTLRRSGKHEPKRLSGVPQQHPVATYRAAWSR